MTLLPRVGDRFRLVRDVDRYPHFIAAEGTVGTVTSLDWGRGAWLQLDVPVPGAEHWDNHIVWEAIEDFWADVEPVRESERAVSNNGVDPDSAGADDSEIGAADNVDQRAGVAESGSPMLIGRTGAIVPDPFNQYRSDLGAYAQEIDDVATLGGLSIVGKGEDELQEIRAELISSLTSELDPERAALSQDWRLRIDAAEDLLTAAREDLLVLEGEAHSTRGHRADLADALDEARERVRVLDHTVTRAYNANESGGNRYDADGGFDMESYNAVSEAQGYLASWVADNGATLAGIVAVDRELAISRALRELDVSGQSQAQVVEGVTFKEIGTDGPVLLAERRMRKSGWNEHLERSMSAPAISREDVSQPPMLDRSYDALGRRHRDDLIEQTAPLARWVAEQPDDRIYTRRDDLRGVLPPVLEGAAALRAGRLEITAVIAAGERDSAREQAAQFEIGNPERAAVEARRADQAEETLRACQQELSEMRQHLIHPDVALEAAQDHWRRQQLYEREYQIRRRMDIAEGVQRSVEEQPSKYLLEQLGPPPERETPEYAQWRPLARDVETHRLTEVSAKLEGLDTPERDPQVEQRLHDRIDHYRATLGMEPLARQPNAKAVALETLGRG